MIDDPPDGPKIKWGDGGGACGWWWLGWVSFFEYDMAVCFLLNIFR
jgi:hypothetical protein